MERVALVRVRSGQIKRPFITGRCQLLLHLLFYSDS